MGAVIQSGRFSFAVPALGLDPSNKNANISLSVANRKATKNSGGIGWVAAKSLTSHATGKWYLEWTPDEFSGSFIGLGFGTAAATLNNYLGSQASSIGLISNGEVFRNGAAVSVLPRLVEGDNISAAIDLDNDLCFFRRNGGNWNGSGTGNPVTGVGGLALNAGMVTASPAIFAGVSLQQSPLDSSTINTGQAAFAHPVPFGFTAWG